VGGGEKSFPLHSSQIGGRGRLNPVNLETFLLGKEGRRKGRLLPENYLLFKRGKKEGEGITADYLTRCRRERGFAPAIHSVVEGGTGHTFARSSILSILETLRAKGGKPAAQGPPSFATRKKEDATE